MPTGILAIATIVLTILAVVYVTWNRKVIYGTPSATSASGQQPAASQPARRARPAPAHRLRRRAGSETRAKSDEIVSSDVSGIETPDSDPETIAFRVVAKLIKAGHVTETVALSTGFSVKPGGSPKYKEAQKKLKAAQAELGE